MTNRKLQIIYIFTLQGSGAYGSFPLAPPEGIWGPEESLWPPEQIENTKISNIRKTSNLYKFD